MMIGFIVKNWKWVLIAGLLIALLLGVHSCNQYKKNLADIIKAKQFDSDVANSKLAKWKDANGYLHTRVENLQVGAKHLQGKVDSLSRLLNVKPKQIQVFSTVGTSISVRGKLTVDTAAFKSVPCGSDSIYIPSAYSLSWRDQWMQVRADLNGENDSVFVFGTDTLHFVSYWKRGWFLGAKRYYTDISNVNRHISISGYKGVQFKGTEKRWNVSLSISGGYPIYPKLDLSKPFIIGGLSAGYSLFRF